jgi:toxin FitB
VNVVDSSGWLEYFADAPNAEFFAGPISDTEHLLVPTISLLEVFARAPAARRECCVAGDLRTCDKGGLLHLMLRRQ